MSYDVYIKPDPFSNTLTTTTTTTTTTTNPSDAKVYSLRKRTSEDAEQPQPKRAKKDSHKYTVVDGKKEGPASITTAKGTIDFIYKEGIKEGPATETRPDGTTISFIYVGGIREGDACLTDKNGVMKFTYRKGSKEGLAEMKLYNGISLYFMFNNNQVIGDGEVKYKNRTLPGKIINGVFKCEGNIKKLMEEPQIYPESFLNDEYLKKLGDELLDSCSSQEISSEDSRSSSSNSSDLDQEFWNSLPPLE